MRWVADASAIGDLIITVATRNADANATVICGHLDLFLVITTAATIAMSMTITHHHHQ